LLPQSVVNQFGKVHKSEEFEGYIGLIFENACQLLFEVEYDAEQDRFNLLVNDLVYTFGDKTTNLPTFILKPVCMAKAGYLQ
jgi:hypothetical protein